MTTTETWQHRDIITNGIRMHYVTQGEGPLVVLLHGFPEFWYSWRFQIPFLAGLGYQVVAPDLRGYNDTDKPRHGYDMQTLMRDIVGLIRGLEYEKAVLVGHDWGGAIAWAFAMRYPDMTDKLIVMNAPHPWAFERELHTFKQRSKSWYVLAFQLPWLPEYLLTRKHAQLIGRTLYESAVQKSAFPPDVLQRYQEAMSKPRAMTSSLQYYRSIFRNNLLRGTQGTLGVSHHAKIPAPTLLIWGEQDVALDIALTEGLEEWVPHIVVRRIAESGHWVQQEQAGVVNGWMGEFLGN